MNVAIKPFANSVGPTPNAETQAFWTATRERKFILPKCTSCSKYHWYPRAFCPFCHRAVEWVPVSGLGTVYSVTRMGSGDAAYCLAYIELDEGPKMLSNLVAADDIAPAIGDKVQVTFHALPNGEMLPVFQRATVTDE